MNTSADTAITDTATVEQAMAQLITDTLNLEHLTIADIPVHQPLFGGGLGLDSGDGPKLALALLNACAMRIESDAKESRRHFCTVDSLAAFVQEQRTVCAD